MERLAPAAPFLAGRDAEVVALQQCLSAAQAGQGVLVLLSGEAGIGKTSLATTIGHMARATGMTFAIGRCYEGGGAPAFAPWHDVLADLRAQQAIEVAALPPPFGDAPPATTAFAQLQAVARHVAAAARTHPLVVLLDDLHWADPDTLELLWFVTRDLAGVPLVLLATYRSEDARRGHALSAALPRLLRDRPVETVRLTALRPDDTARLVEARYGPCSAELAAYLHTRAEGNPFFVVELLRDLAERRALARDADGRLALPAPSDRDHSVPALLQHVITQRVGRLDREAERLLEVAAVVGEEWDLAVVEGALGWPEERLLGALEAALAAQVVVPAPAEQPGTAASGTAPSGAVPAAAAERYRFAHALIREVLYQQPVARRRRHLHGRVATALEALATAGAASADPAALAHHFAAAGQWDRVVPPALAAGDAARDRYATRSAVRHYAHARDALQRAPHAIDWATAVTVFDRLAQAYMVLNQQEQAEEALTRLLAAARAGDDRTAEGQALAWLALIRARLNRMDEARSTGATALHLADQVQDTHLRALAHATVGHVHEVAGDLEAGRRHAELAVGLARAGGHADVLRQCLQDLAMMAIWRGDYARAEHLAGEATATAREGHDAQSLTGACFRLGLALGERGHYDDARRAVQRGLDHAAEAGERRNLAKLLNTMGWLHSELGDFEQARHWDGRALDASRQGADVWVLEAERYSLLNLATDALRAGDLGAAEARLAEVEALLDRSQYSRFRYLNRYQLLRAEAALARADHALALRWADEANALAVAKGMRKNVARSLLLRGWALSESRRADEAVHPLRQALGLADALDHGSLRWQARLWLGQAQAALHQPAAAQACYARALEQVTAVADGLADERVRDRFLASPPVCALHEAAAAVGARPARQDRQDRQHRQDRPAYPAALSAREVEVLRLVAQGATNAAIAASLSISPRTVDVHLSNIFGKTGCANRAAAAVFAQRHGLC